MILLFGGAKQGKRKGTERDNTKGTTEGKKDKRQRRLASAGVEGPPSTFLVMTVACEVEPNRPSLGVADQNQLPSLFGALELAGLVGKEGFPIYTRTKGIQTSN